MSIVNVGAAENDGTGDPWRDAFRKLNAVGGGVISRTTDDPASPSDGDFYIVPASATGAFVGQDNNLAWYNSDTPGWEFTTTPEGFQTWVRDTDERIEWNGSAWQNLAGGVADFDSLSDTDTDASTLGVPDIGRVLGYKGSGVYGLLDTVAQVNPLGGGVEILGEWDIDATPVTEMEILGIDKFARIEWFFYNFGQSAGVADNVNFSFSTDNGATDETHTFEVGVLEGSSAADDVDNGGTTLTSADIFIMNAGRTDASGHLIISGLGTSANYLRSEVLTYQAADYLRKMHNVHDISNVNSMRIHCDANIDNGKVVALGFKANIQPMSLGFKYKGSPSVVETLDEIVLGYNITIPAGAAGSFRVNSNPTVAAIVNIKRITSVPATTTIGTISIATDGTCTVNITAEIDIDAGDILFLESDGAEDFTDLIGGIQAVARDA